MPYRDQGYFYYRRFDAGDEYPVYARRLGSLDAPEQVLLDLEAQARGLDYYDIGALEVSHDNRLLAYTDDTVGRRQHTLRFKSLETGVVLPDAIPNVEEPMAWGGDNRTVFYVEKDPVTLLGTARAQARARHRSRARPARLRGSRTRRSTLPSRRRKTAATS